MNNAEVGARIRKAREAANEKSVPFAEKLGIGRDTLDRYELGKGSPRADFLIGVANVCGVSAAWLLTGEGEMRPPAKAEFHAHTVADDHSMAGEPDETASYQARFDPGRFAEILAAIRTGFESQDVHLPEAVLARLAAEGCASEIKYRARKAAESKQKGHEK